MKNIFENKDILVTGGCGSIGSEIVKQLIKFNPKKIRVLDNNESNLFYLGQELKNKIIRLLIGDIRDRNRIYRATKDVDVVFHAAALKHVSLCEYNPFDAVSTNIIGTENLVSACMDNDVAKFVGISTDKAVNPINTMGATKLLSEKIITDTAISSLNTKFCCVRFGNVLDSVGSVVPIFKQQIKKGGPVTITDRNMIRFFMTKFDAINLVLKAAEKTQGGEIFILKMKKLKIMDLAQAMIDEFAPKYGYNPKDIKYEFIGIRSGEKIDESLMNEEELNYAEDIGDMYVVRNRWGSNVEIRANNHRSKMLKDVKFLNIEDIKEVLHESKIV